MMPNAAEKIEQLAREAERLKIENEELSKTLATIASENVLLKKEVDELRSKLKTQDE